MGSGSGESGSGSGDYGGALLGGDRDSGANAANASASPSSGGILGGFFDGIASHPISSAINFGASILGGPILGGLNTLSGQVFGNDATIGGALTALGRSIGSGGAISANGNFGDNSGMGSPADFSSILGLGAAGASLGSSIANATSGGGGSSSPLGTQGGNPASYIPTGQGGADSTYQQIVNSMTPFATSFPGQQQQAYGQQVGGVLNNPYAATAQGSAANISQLGLNTVAPQQFGGAQALYGMGQSAVPYASQILQQGFDPQNALYDRTVQRLQDQIRSANAASGTAGTPYGAGLEGQGLGNFNIDWQNSQLGREATAAQGFGSLVNSAGRSFAGASDLGTGGLSTLNSSGALPYQTYLGQRSDNLNALNTLGSGVNASYGVPGQELNALAAYLRLGQSATGNAQAGQATNFLQQSQIGNNIGATLANPALASSLNTLFAPAPSPISQPGLDPNVGIGQQNYVDPFLSMYGSGGGSGY